MTTPSLPLNTKAVTLLKMPVVGLPFENLDKYYLEAMKALNLELNKTYMIIAVEVKE